VSAPWAFLRGYGTAGPGQPVSRVPAEFAAQLPEDTVAAAQVTAGIRLECIGTATGVTLGFAAGEPAARHAPTMANAFSVWLGDRLETIVPVGAAGEVTIALPARGAEDVVTIYLPDPTPITVTSVRADGGTLEPAAPQPRWVVYGDSIAQGWSASDPGLTWPARAGRALGLDPINLGFAGAARGEAGSAAHVAATPADIITLAWGTNCWSMVPFDEEQMRSTMRAFLETVRAQQPDVPIVVVSPITRPEVEQTENVRGATLAQLRAAAEEAVRDFAAESTGVHLLPGLGLVPGPLLVDGVHPGDEGHQLLADAIVLAVRGVWSREQAIG
jgi:lysophospholipase L1-like esterase